jgi:hypothetical protein
MVQMNQRIRYNKVSNDKLVSRRTFSTASGAEVVVELNIGAKKYRVLDAATNQEISSGGNTRNVAVLKIQAKRGLKDLGVEFADETRDRGGVEVENQGRPVGLD